MSIRQTIKHTLEHELEPHQASAGRHHMLAALFFDLGDTIMIEESEVKDKAGTTLCAELIPGMPEALRRFKTQGHRLALVADSRPMTPIHVLEQHGLRELFDHLAISECLGFEKPDPRIEHPRDALAFETAKWTELDAVGKKTWHKGVKQFKEERTLRPGLQTYQWKE